ncbi:uncharacterized protein LOC132993778 isoform X1 [Labrus mixtus]|uniref:uncharacterized protein LOC132993778 isoform X1 n=1 Tax=Labrus mixtus TaxID=508554 RepID=UPI0029C0E6D6|nr:uncharacterized protein LOC132993778 isoform X1 [Labrus mixtus]
MEAVFLLLFLCLSPVVGQGQVEVSAPRRDGVRMVVRRGLDDVRMQADVPPDLAVLWDELQGLKDLVLSLKAAEVGQRQSLRNMESRLRDGEMEVEQQRHSMEGLTETLSQYRKEMINPALRTEADRKPIVLNTDLSKKVEKLEEQSKALALELPFLQTRLRASELTVEQLRRKSAVLAVRVCNTESLMKELRRQSSAAFASNSSSEVSERQEELNSNTPDQKERQTEGQQLNELPTQSTGKPSEGALTLAKWLIIIKYTQ